MERADELGCEQAQLVEVGVCELAQQLRPARGDRDLSAAAIIGGALAAHEAADLEPVQQLDDRVVLQCEVIGERLDAGLDTFGEAAQREQELVLARLEADLAGGRFGECEELPELEPEVRERAKVCSR